MRCVFGCWHWCGEGLLNAMKLPVFLSCLTLSGATIAMDHSTEVAEFVAASREGVAIQTEAHRAWGLGAEENWAVDQDLGQLQFFFEDGRVATASVQIVGTYNPTDGTFMWGWDHPSVAPSLRSHAQLAKDFGDRHEAEAFTSLNVACTEDEAWGLTSVAARLGNANGVYRANAGGPWVYMTFGDVRIEQRGPQSGAQ